MIRTITLAVLLFVTTLSFGQANKGLNFGLGLSDGGIPVYLSYDFPVAANLSVAPFVETNLDGFNWITPGVKVDYYFDQLLGMPDAFDFYAGGNAGFIIYMGNHNDSGTGNLHLGLEVGGRWWFSDKWGLNLEFAGGTGYRTKLGLSMKM